MIRVMVIDDSALVRDVLATGLGRDPAIQVVGTAVDPFDASEKIPRLKPDVITLDVEMPRMNGLEFLRRLLPQYPVPVVKVSALTEKGKQLTLDALAIGAVDFVTKPRSDLARGMEALLAELTVKIKIAASARLLRFTPHTSTRTAPAPASPPPVRPASSRLVILVASTGGTEAVREVTSHFPEDTPAVLVVQHMPAGFTRLFAQRLAGECAMDATEAKDGDVLTGGRILVAPGGMQTRVRRNPGGGFRLAVTSEGTLGGHAPAADATLASAAEAGARDMVAVVMTGMGADGAEGLKMIRNGGGRCLAQDEATSVVFGMPAEAYKRGGAERLVPLGDIADAVLSLLPGKK